MIYQLLSPVEKTAFHPVSMNDLRGVWTTTQPRYRDRFLQFGDGTITFGWGDAGEGSYSIVHMGSEPAGKNTLVNIRYVDLSSTRYQLNFYYERREGGMIRLKYQNGVYWYRTGARAIHKPSFK